MSLGLQDQQYQFYEVTSQDHVAMLQGTAARDVARHFIQGGGNRMVHVEWDSTGVNFGPEIFTQRATNIHFK